MGSSPQKKISYKFVLYSTLIVLVVGILLFASFHYTPWVEAKISSIWESLDSSILIFIMVGFFAQVIDGSLGMAYGVSATSFLMAFGLSPAAASASVHSSEIFTSGVSGLSHLRFGNVNKKLFRHLLIPGVIGSIIGAFLVSSLEEYNQYIRPIVALYTLYLGIRVIEKVSRKKRRKKPVKRLGWLAGIGGFLDAIGGGGWGPIVSSSLIAKGRSPIYTIGSVNLTEFFVSLASSITFVTVIGFHHWQIILGLILGGTFAAPIGPYMVRKIPMRPMFIFVGVVVIIISVRTFLKSLGVF